MDRRHFLHATAGAILLGAVLMGVPVYLQAKIAPFTEMVVK